MQVALTAKIGNSLASKVSDILVYARLCCVPAKIPKFLTVLLAIENSRLRTARAEVLHYRR